MNVIAVYGLALLLTFSFGGGVGYKLTANHYKAQQVDDIKNAVKNSKALLLSAFEQEKKAIDLIHQEELKNNVITREVPKYISKIQRIKSDCSYSNGTVRLLNESAENNAKGSDSSIPAAKDAAASDITESAGIKYTHDLLYQYNLWMIKHNALIDFINNNGK